MIGAGGAVRSNNVVTFTTTAAHPFRKGAMATIAGIDTASFNGTFQVASVLSGTQFTMTQNGPNESSGNGTATTQNIGGAMTGGCFYESTAFPAAYRGNYFFGDYNSGRIMRPPLDADNLPSRTDEFVNSIGSHVDMTTGPDGALYYANQSSPGTIRRLLYNGTAQEVIIYPTAFNVVEGGAAVISVRLRSAPASNITVSLEQVGGDADLRVRVGTPPTVTFTPSNFATPQLFTVAAVDDADLENDSATFRIFAPGIGSYDLPVNGIDNDEPQLVVSTTALNVNEASSNTFTVRLANAPLAPVTVSVSRTAGDSDVSVSGGSSLEFTPADYATPKTVTIAAANDADNTNDTATITVATTGEISRNVAVLVADNDPLAPSFTSSPIMTAVDDAAYSYDANAAGNPAPTFALTTAPSGMSIDAATGLISWTPAAPGSLQRYHHGDQQCLEPPSVLHHHGQRRCAPRRSLTRPVAGEIMSGTTAEFFGDGIDDVSTVKAEFFVDDVLRYTDVNNGNHFHFGGAHTLFDTTQYTNGPHTLRMRVTDTRGQTAEQEVQVTIGNGGAAWQTQYFPDVNDPNRSFTADPGSDGEANLFEYLHRLRSNRAGCQPRTSLAASGCQWNQIPHSAFRPRQVGQRRHRARGSEWRPDQPNVDANRPRQSYIPDRGGGKCSVLRPADRDCARRCPGRDNPALYASVPNEALTALPGSGLLLHDRVRSSRSTLAARLRPELPESGAAPRCLLREESFPPRFPGLPSPGRRSRQRRIVTRQFST